MFRVTEGKITVKCMTEIHGKSSLCKVRVSEGSSYRESTVILQHKMKQAYC